MEQAKKISTAVTEFYQERLTYSPEFNLGELQSYAAARVPEINLDSIDRILRKLRQKNLVNYVVLNRNKSLYQALPVAQG